MRRDIIWIMGLLIIGISIDGLAKLPLEDGFGKNADDLFHGEKVNDTLASLFGNLSEFKNKWAERFGKNFWSNESEEEWKRWRNEWMEKFNETSKELKEKWKNSTKHFLKMVHNHSFIGRLDYENGYCAGNFVKFIFDNGEIVDYTVIRENNITVFDFVRILDFSQESEPEVHGSVWRVRGDNADIEIHDNPSALLKVKAKSTVSIELNLPDNTSVEYFENSSNILKIYNDEIEGKIIIAGNGSFDVSEDTILVETNHGNLVFMVSPHPEVCVRAENQYEYEEKIAKAIQNNRICARIFVQLDNNTDETLFCDANMSCHTYRNRIRLRVSASGEGKVIVLDIHKDVFNITDITVLLDNETIPMADDYDDILNIEENETAEYLIVYGENGLQVLVYIPSFSTHVIDILAIQLGEGAGAGGEFPGFGILIAVIALSLAFLMSIKRRK